MLDYYARVVVDFIQAHPHWGQFFTFFIAFLESLAVIGTIIPGSVTMTAIGALVGAAIFPAGLTLLMATLGALTGDWLGYWFGKYYANEIRDFKIFRRYGKWFDSGEAFFHKHGGKSVIIGRFFGPVRSFVPMIAGILQMPTLRFAIAVVPAAALWSMAYMLPGIILGALSLEMPAGMATKFILYALFGILVIWFISVLIKLFFQTLWIMFDQSIQNLWYWMRDHKPSEWLIKLLSDPKEPDRHRQLMLFFIFIISLLGLIGLTINVIHHGILTHFNDTLFHLLSSIRTPRLDKIFVVITTLGDRKVMVAIAATLTIVFAAFRFWRTCFHWVLNTSLIIVSTKLMKHFIFSPRPLPVKMGSSFPSGHTAMTFGILGFLAVIISTHLSRDAKKKPYLILSFVGVAIAFSRLYLGAHWLTDIFGGMLLALVCLSFTTISYRRCNLNPISVPRLIFGSLAIIISIWLVASIAFFEEHYQRYQLVHPTINITENQWWNGVNHTIPKYRLNRLGNPKVPFNIQWNGSAESIKKHLATKGWKEFSPGGDLKSIIERLSETQNGIRLLLLPQLHLNKPPQLLMIKVDKTNTPILKLQMWESKVYLGDDKSFMIGTVSEYLTPKKYLFGRKKNRITEFNDVIPEFKKEVTDLKSRTFIAKVPHQESMLRWNGTILKIQE